MTTPLPLAVPLAAPDLAHVEEAWRRFACAERPATADAFAELQQTWPILLAGLPAVAAGAVRDERSQPLALTRLVAAVLERNQDDAGNRTGTGGGTVGPFLP